jgi:hypothetical protein
MIHSAAVENSKKAKNIDILKELLLEKSQKIQRPEEKP